MKGKPKQKRKKLYETDKKELCNIFISLGGMAVGVEYNSELCGVHQIENVNLQTLSISTSLTNN